MSKAIWVPTWFCNDQSLKVGVMAEFAFHPLDTDGEGGASSIRFFNDPMLDQEVWFARGKVVSIYHQEIGDILSIETGLAYTFRLADGGVMVVNAEEEPGTILGDPSKAESHLSAQYPIGALR